MIKMNDKKVDYPNRKSYYVQFNDVSCNPTGFSKLKICPFEDPRYHQNHIIDPSTCLLQLPKKHHIFNTFFIIGLIVNYIIIMWPCECQASLAPDLPRASKNLTVSQACQLTPVSIPVLDVAHHWCTPLYTTAFAPLS